MAVEGISGMTRAGAIQPNKTKVPESTSNASMTISDFYTLLAAQMKYQDADNPMDTSEMMATMVQTQMIEAITQMTAMNTTTYAASMMGKQVTVALMDQNGMYAGDKTGEVTGVVLGDNPILFVDGEGYYLNQVVAVGDVPKNEEKPDTGEGGDGGDDQKPTEPIEPTE